MRSRPTFNALLALLLLLAQQLTTAHAVSHRDEGGAPPHVCEMCALAAQLGSGAPSAALILPVTTPAVECQPHHAAVHAARRLLAFPSRAPPPALF